MMRKLIYVLLSCAILLAVLLKLLPYLLNNYEFLIGFDSGMYEKHFEERISTSIDNIDIWVEPGLNTSLVSLNSLLNLSPQFYFKIFLPTFFSIYFVTSIFLIGRYYSKSSVGGIISAFYFASSVIFLNATFDSFYRQIYSTAIFLVFVYFLDKYFIRESSNWKVNTVLSILAAGIIMSHRAITLLLFLSLFITGLILLKQKNKAKLKKLILYMLAAVSLSSVYLIPILGPNLIIMSETVKNSLNHSATGDRVIKSLKREDNQLVGYFYSNIISFVPFIGVVYMTLKNKFKFIGIFTITLLIYIATKLSFSNRFIFNLEIIFSIFIGVTCSYLLKGRRKHIAVACIMLFLIFNFLSTFNYSVQRKPYVPSSQGSLTWIKDNISKEDSLIIAPDAMSTILTQMGYKTALYEYKVKLGSGGADIGVLMENYLTDPNNNESFLDNFRQYHNIYVATDYWNTIYPMQRANAPISTKIWDSNSTFKKIYTSKDYVLDIYKYE
jgi:hypothetical protein